MVFAAILQRLDDVSDPVRLLALEALCTMPTSFKEDSLASQEVSALVSRALKTLLLHMDDKEEQMRDKCLGE